MKSYTVKFATYVTVEVKDGTSYDEIVAEGYKLAMDDILSAGLSYEYLMDERENILEEGN